MSQDNLPPTSFPKPCSPTDLHNPYPISCSPYTGNPTFHDASPFSFGLSPIMPVNSSNSIGFTPQYFRSGMKNCFFPSGSGSCPSEFAEIPEEKHPTRSVSKFLDAGGSEASKVSAHSLKTDKETVTDDDPKAVLVRKRKDAGKTMSFPTYNGIPILHEASSSDGPSPILPPEFNDCIGPVPKYFLTGTKNCSFPYETDFRLPELARAQEEEKHPKRCDGELLGLGASSAIMGGEIDIDDETDRFLSRKPKQPSKWKGRWMKSNANFFGEITNFDDLVKRLRKIKKKCKKCASRRVAVID